MPVLAGVSPPAQAMLLRVMPELRRPPARERPAGLPIACPGIHLMPTITPDKVFKQVGALGAGASSMLVFARAGAAAAHPDLPDSHGGLQDWASCVQAFVMGTASVVASAVQLWEPGAAEARHKEVFEAAAAPLMALQRQRQLRSNSWCFVRPEDDAYSTAALFDLLRRYTSGTGQRPGAFPAGGGLLGRPAWEACLGDPCTERPPVSPPSHCLHVDVERRRSVPQGGRGAQDCNGGRRRAGGRGAAAATRCLLGGWRGAWEAGGGWGGAAL